MSNDKIRDAIFSLAQEHKFNTQMAEDFRKEKNEMLLKKSKKVVTKLEKKIDKLLSKLPDRYPYKKDLVTMISGLLYNSRNVFRDL